jgi:hypothetical protein
MLGRRGSLGAGDAAVRACLIVLLLLVPAMTGPGRVGATSDKVWRSPALRLTLSYPPTWKIVPERSAAVLLRSASGKAEFEIFPLASGSAGNTLGAATGHALVTAKCHTAVKVSSVSVGRLGASGREATGLCTGSDLGWRLSVTAFRYAGNNLLLRAWLFHADVVGGRDLSAIRASISKTS